MSADGPEHGLYNFGRARVAAGLLSIVGGVLLVFVDALLGRDVDGIVLGLLLSTGVVLLGVETIRKGLGG